MPTEVANEIRLSIKCSKLPNVDGFLGKSDPRCDVYRKDDSNPSWFLVGSTEHIRNNPNPEFKTKIFTTYEFKDNPQLKFHVIDVDHKDANKWESIGAWIIPLQQLNNAPDGMREGDLVNENRSGDKPGGLGSISVRAEVTKGRPGDIVKLKMKGTNIANKDGLKGASDPYLIFKKVLPTKTTENVAGGKTPYVSNTKTPEFQPVYMNLMDLCNGQFDQPISVEAWDYDSLSSHDQIGVVETTLSALLSKEPIQLKDYKEGRDLDPGQIQLVEGGIIRVPTFQDYQTEPGTKLHVTFGIDFTVTEDEKVHRKHDHAFNLYEQAIHNAGETLSDDLGAAPVFNAFGFGAKYNGGSEISHCFELGKGLKKAQDVNTKYWGCIKQKKVEMERTRHLNEILKKGMELASDQSTPHYEVLVIVTHNVSDDTHLTLPALVEASKLPISVLIVGVGDGDFTNYKDLVPVTLMTHGEPPLQTSTSGTADRNILQFVKGSSNLGIPVKQVIPKQFLQYMSLNKVAPRAWEAQSYILPENTTWQPKELVPAPDPNAAFRDLDIGDAADLPGPAGA